MESVIAKLGIATGPSREIDHEIAQIIGLVTPQNTVTVWPPEFSASIDAALTLVPSDMTQWVASNRALFPHAGRGYIHNGELHMSGNYQGFEAIAATPAIALCIVALRARAQSEGRKG